MNIAYIDGQNLYLGALTAGYKIDFARFRIYLKDKYKIDKAYYFLGFKEDILGDLYENLQEAGFILLFKKTNPHLESTKKGNVDADLVFRVMKDLCFSEKKINKMFLVSGDGDYRRLVDFLIERGKFGKILFPNRQYKSSLYRKLHPRFYLDLDNEEVKKKFEFKKTKTTKKRK